MIAGIKITDIFRSSGSVGLKAVKLIDHLLGGVIVRCLPRRQTRSLPETIHRLLIIRPGGMGDAVFLLPLLRELRGQYPSMEITVLCEKRNRAIFTSQQPLINHVFCYDHFLDLIHVSCQSYDAVIDSEQWHYLSAVLAYGIRRAYTVGFATRLKRDVLYDKAVKYDSGYELSNFQRLFNVVFRSLPEIKSLKGSYRVGDDLHRWASLQVSSVYVVLFMGGNIPSRRFECEQLCSMVEYLKSRQLTVVLLGGRDARALSKQVQEKIGDQGVGNLVGILSLEQSVAIIANAKGFIGADSGLLHVACALGIPSAGVFSSGQVDKWGLTDPDHFMVKTDLPCSPCTRFGYTLPECNNRFPCIRQRSLNEIKIFINTMT